jgi:hypothetical protein
MMHGQQNIKRNRKVLKLGITAVLTGKSSQISLFWNVEKDQAIDWRVIIECEARSSICKENLGRVANGALNFYFLSLVTFWASDNPGI